MEINTVNQSPAEAESARVFQCAEQAGLSDRESAAGPLEALGAYGGSAAVITSVFRRLRLQHWASDSCEDAAFEI